MKLTQLNFLIFALILLGITSCKKDIETPGKDNADTTDFIEGRNDPFFDDSYIISALSIVPETEMPSSHKEVFKDYISNLSNSDQLISYTTSNIGYPCWECGDVEYCGPVGYFFTYIPVYSTTTYETEGIIIGKSHVGSFIDFYIADKSLLAADQTGYWAGIFEFFNQRMQNQSPTKDGNFRMVLLPCPVVDPPHDEGVDTSVGSCVCNGAFSCSIMSTSSDVEGCENSVCVPSGGGNGGEGNNNEEGPDYPDIPVDYSWLEQFLGWWWSSTWWTNYMGGNLGGSLGSGLNGLDEAGFFDLGDIDNFNDYLIADLVNGLKRRHGLYLPANQLYNMLVDCGIDTYLEFKYDIFSPYQDLPECVKDIILQNDILHLQLEDGFILTEEEIQEIYPDVMLYSGDFPAYKKTGLINYLKDVLEFSDGIESWLNSNGQYFSYSVIIYKYLNANDFSEESKNVINSIFNFVEQKGFEENASKSAKAISAFVESGKLEGPYTDDERDEIVEDYFINNPDLYIQYLTRCIILRTEWENNNPGQTCGILCLTDIALEAYWQTVGGVVHTALDICGLVPAWGEPCDLVNGTLYLIEGDGVNATISFAASIPIVGWVATGSRWVKIAIEVAPGVYKNLKITRQASGLLTFSHNTSTAFRQILNITGPNWTSFQAHHLIPKNFANHAVVQKAAASRDFTFHMNHPRNGTPLHNSRHQGYHNNYNNQIEDLLDDLEEAYPNATASEIATALEGFQTYLRNTVEQSSQHINDIIIDYTW